MVSSSGWRWIDQFVCNDECELGIIVSIYLGTRFELKASREQYERDVFNSITTEIFHWGRELD